MRTLLPLLVLLLTASAAWAGSPEADAQLANFGVALLLWSCFFAVIVVLLLLLVARAVWRLWNPPTRRNNRSPAGSEQTPALPPFPRQGA